MSGALNFRLLFISLIATGFALLSSFAAFAAVDPGYAGSSACRPCHEEIYRLWTVTPHARFMKDARKDPSAVMAKGFDQEEPFKIPFKREDILFTLGTRVVQRYLTQRNGQHFVLPRYWDLDEGKWSLSGWYGAEKDSWETHCAGCHTVGFDAKSGGYAEISIGCEACHGSGQNHCESQTRDSIVNPARLDTMRRDMICEACHTDGKDSKTMTLPYPSGFTVGQNLTDFYTAFFIPKPHSGGWYWGDLTYTERHRAFLVVQLNGQLRDRRAYMIEPWFGRQEEYDRFESLGKFLYPSERCGRCHLTIYQTFKSHSGHEESQAECQDCHTPTVTRDGTRYSIHDHKFDYSRPLPIPCEECHGPQLLDPKGKPLRGTDGTLAAEPQSHKEFPFRPVRVSSSLSRVDACRRCHQERDAGWVKASVASFMELRKNALPPASWQRRWR